MPTQQVTSVRFSKSILEQLDGIAKQQDRSRSWVIKEAVRQYLDYEAWFAERVREGVEAVERGDVVSHADAKERIRSLGVTID
ncbi:MAG: CopG family ribbon-helix-helix protein [Desulfovibrionaceae bacterium]